MAKNSEKSNRPGPDKPYYETKSGVVFSPAYLSNDITGAPPAPAMRGGPDDPGTGSLGDGSPRTGNNGIPGKFFSKGG